MNLENLTSHELMESKAHVTKTLMNINLALTKKAQVHAEAIHNAIIEAMKDGFIVDIYNMRLSEVTHIDANKDTEYDLDVHVW